jgi:hypothetical protein
MSIFSMSVYQQQIRPAVVIIIEKATAPAYKPRILAHSRIHRGVFKLSLSAIVVKRFQFVGEVGAKNRFHAVVRIIGRRGAHA